MSKNNWERLVKNYGEHIGCEYTDDEGMMYKFVGILHSDDDFYFAIVPQGGVDIGVLIRLSCVCALESYGYDRI